MMKILIADDEATNRHLLSAALKKLGYEVEVTTNGEQAWEALQRAEAAELAILDWMMPGMTGPEICLKLRARENAKYIYVILLTGMTELTALVEGLESGADDFIHKPFRIPELYARLRAGQRILSLQRELLAGRAQIEHLAAHDSLTGLWNRRAILEQLVRELARSNRESKPLGVILMDIDHFKQINDSYGHAQGDLVLQEVAKRLTEVARPYDGAGRYGGEEFLLYAINCGMEQTSAMAERLRDAIAEKPMKVTDKLLRVTASFGVSSAKPGKTSDVKDLIDAADRALYHAKNLGRNRVERLYAPDGAQVARSTTTAPFP